MTDLLSIGFIHCSDLEVNEKIVRASIRLAGGRLHGGIGRMPDAFVTPYHSPQSDDGSRPQSPQL